VRTAPTTASQAGSPAATISHAQTIAQNGVIVDEQNACGTVPVDHGCLGNRHVVSGLDKADIAVDAARCSAHRRAQGQFNIIFIKRDLVLNIARCLQLASVLCSMARWAAQSTHIIFTN